MSWARNRHESGAGAWQAGAGPEETQLIDGVLRLAHWRRATARAEGRRRARAAEERHWAEVRAPAYRQVMEAEAAAQMTNAALARRQTQHHEEAAARQRKRAARRNGLSRDEVDERVWAAVDDEAARTKRLGGAGGLGQGAGETGAAWRARVRALDTKVRRLWINNEERIVDAERRYVEGLPAREALRPPVFRPRGAGPRASGLGACLQCAVKKMACSRTTTAAGTGADHACRRCERNGEEACLVPAGDGPTAPAPRPSSSRPPAGRRRLQRGVAGAGTETAWRPVGGAGAGDDDDDHRRRERLVRAVLDRDGVELGDGRRVRTATFALPIWWDMLERRGVSAREGRRGGEGEAGSRSGEQCRRLAATGSPFRRQ